LTGRQHRVVPLRNGFAHVDVTELFLDQIVCIQVRQAEVRADRDYGQQNPDGGNVS
jgi:hypothetical protein